MSRHTHGQACSSTAMSAEIAIGSVAMAHASVAQHISCLYLHTLTSFSMAESNRNSLQVVRAPLTRPPTGHRLQDVAPALLLYRWRPSAEVPSHLPQTKSPLPAFAVPVQVRQCRQQVTSADELRKLLQQHDIYEHHIAMQPVMKTACSFIRDSSLAAPTCKIIRMRM